MADMDTRSGWTPPAGRWSDAVGRSMVEAFLASGLSRGAFARRHGLTFQRVKYWLDRIAGRPAQPSGVAAVAFAPVRVVETAGALEVVVGCAVVRVVRDFDPAHLCRVVAALGGLPC